MDDCDRQELQEQIVALRAELARLETLLPRRRPARRQARPGWGRRLALAALLTLPVAAYAATISLPHTFQNGTIADANEVNANFDALVGESNQQNARLDALETGPLTSDLNLGGFSILPADGLAQDSQLVVAPFAPTPGFWRNQGQLYAASGGGFRSGGPTDGPQAAARFDYAAIGGGTSAEAALATRATVALVNFNCVCDGKGTAPYGSKVSLFEDPETVCGAGGGYVCPDGFGSGVDDGLCVDNEQNISATGCDEGGRNFFWNPTHVDRVNELIEIPAALSGEFSSGEGPFRIFTAGAGLPSTSLADNQVVWVSASDATHIRLHTSQAEASAGSNPINLNVEASGYLSEQGTCAAGETCETIHMMYPWRADRVDGHESVAGTGEASNQPKALVWGICSDDRERACHDVHAPCPTGTCDTPISAVVADAITAGGFVCRLTDDSMRPSPKQAADNGNSDSANVATCLAIDLRFSFEGASNQMIDHLRGGEIKIHGWGNPKADRLDINKITGWAISDLSHPDISANPTLLRLGAILQKPHRHARSLKIAGGGFDTGSVGLGEFVLWSQNDASSGTYASKLLIRPSTPNRSEHGREIVTGADGVDCPEGGKVCDTALLLAAKDGVSCQEACPRHYVDCEEEITCLRNGGSDCSTSPTFDCDETSGLKECACH